MREDRIADMDAPPTDAKTIASRVAAVNEQVRYLSDDLARIADRWWGPQPQPIDKATAGMGTAPLDTSLHGIHQTLDAVHDGLSQLAETVQRFGRLA